jgi:hypothetical protein
MPGRRRKAHRPGTERGINVDVLCLAFFYVDRIVQAQPSLHTEQGAR